MAAVSDGKSWGYIDKSGKLIVSAKYDKALDFCGGLAPVKSGKTWGYIDITGKTAIPFRFDDAMPFVKVD